MLLKDISLKTPQENIIYDEVLLHLAQQGLSSEVLRLWESFEYFVVLGRICKPEDDVKMDEIKKDQIPVIRRSSGGGTVLQGQGCLNYSLVLSKVKNPQIADLHKSYQWILGKVVFSLKQLGVDAIFFPISDIALVGNNKKISGNAQKRSSKYILHHGTILYDFNLSKIEKYLKVPKNIPAYRQERSHKDFVTNVPLAMGDIKNVLKENFGVNQEETCLNNGERKCLKEKLKTLNGLLNNVE